MARINLLPWREQLREERKQRFMVTLAGVLVVAGGLVFVGDQYLNGAIESQQARNDYLRKEIAVLDARIAEPLAPLGERSPRAQPAVGLHAAEQEPAMDQRADQTQDRARRPFRVKDNPCNPSTRAVCSPHFVSKETS